MGSAAFPVAACRHLARACERALVRDGERHEGNINEGDQWGFRREVAQRCLFGVDLNPAAVQLARFSLWLATLAAEKPLTFLDHRLVAGDSLIGASPMDLARQPPPGAMSSRKKASGNVETPLFDDSHLEPSLAAAVLERTWIADTADDTLQIVREKEQRLARLARTGGWMALADLWCSCWMWPDQGTAPDPAVFASLADHLLRGRSALPRGVSEPLLARSREIAGSHKFFHWMFEFPEVYFEKDGRPLSNPGFDAVLGNPPWDMLRADSPDGAGDVDASVTRPELALAKRFVRGSGVYRQFKARVTSIATNCFSSAPDAHEDGRPGRSSSYRPASRSTTHPRLCGDGCSTTATSTASRVSTPPRHLSDSSQRSFRGVHGNLRAADQDDQVPIRY